MDIRHDSSVLFCSNEPVTVWDSRRLRAHRSNPLHLVLREVIDAMGQGSRLAQNVTQPLTSVQRLESCPEHRLYILAMGRKVLGILKVGVKKLFVRDAAAQLHEIEPLCVLDFYVHEATQRHGHGKFLFESMLQLEKKLPHQLGYDRPSHKFRSFLLKHYALSSYIEQSNNFVVFDVYFDPAYKPESGGGSSLQTPTRGMQQSHAAMNSASRTGPASRPSEPSISIPTSPPPQPRTGPLPHPTHFSQSLSAQKNYPNNNNSQARSSRREFSPTRSGVQYNIITLQEEYITTTPPPNNVHCSGKRNSFHNGSGLRGRNTMLA